MIGGNALGDGKPKDVNGTKDTSQETFAEKYRRELKKDYDDIGLDDEDELDSNKTEGADTAADNEEIDKEKSEADLLESLMGDDDEEEENAEATEKKEEPVKDEM